MPDEQILLRMFFENGRIETRPLAWVRIVSCQEDFDFVEEEEKAIVEGGGEVYIVLVEKLISIQVFKGHFTNARVEREGNRPGSYSERRPYPSRSSRYYRDDQRGRDQDERR